jgi:serine/threonine protein kinase
MDLLTEPVTAQPRSAAEPLSATDWLDAFATGGCDQGTFVRGVGALVEHAPDAGWELLALIDQYYRRGKIDAAAFTSLKTHLQNLLMGQSGTGEISVPLRHTRTKRVPDPDAPPLAPPPASPSVAAPAPAAHSPLLRPAAPASPPAASAAAPAAVRPPDVPAAPRAPAAAPGRASTPRSTGVGVSAPDDEPHAERALAPGDVLRGRYRVVALLGQGGMGSVFEAIDQYRLDRSQADQKVAIKVLHTAVIQRPRLFAELRREFQHLQSLTHPNIVRVHEFDRDGDLAFFTMEYLSGALLTSVIAAHVAASLHRPYAFSIVRDVGAAVLHAHARGVVHGDLNPGNIFITDNGDLRVLDFGAAHQLRRAPWISDFEGSQQITVATPRFASCQLLEGETADARDDVYALACIAYVLLAGSHPYRDHSALKARTLRLKPVRPEGLTRRQWNALRAGLEFERDQRPVDMAGWLADLSSDTAVAHLPELPALMSVRPIRRASKGWMLAAAALTVIGVGVGWVSTHVDDFQESEAGAVAKFKKTFANTVLSQLWDTGHSTGTVPPSMAPADQRMDPDRAALASRAPSKTVPRIAPASEAPPVRLPPPTRTPQTTSRNGPLPLGDAANGAAPGAAATGAGTGGGTGALAAVAPGQPAAGNPVAATAVAASAVAATAVAGTPIHARIELAADNIDVDPGEAVAHVIVRRTRTLRGDVSFSWWTESGTAKPGRDFTPVKTQVEHIEDGRNSADLTVPILADSSSRHDPRSFYIVIDEPSDNAALGARTLTMVTIPGTE